jgi:hypothetical protein
MRQVQVVLGAIAVAAMAGCWMNQPSSDSTPEPPVAGGYAAVAASDALTRQAIDQGVVQLAGAGWLNAPGWTLERIDAAERQVVAGTNHRAMVQLAKAGRRRPAQLTVFHDLQGAYHLSAVELGPVGSDSPFPAVPTATAGLPGGWSDQPADHAMVQEAIQDVKTALAGADWLAQPVTIEAVNAARLQVVAGLNAYLDVTGKVQGQPRRIEAIMFMPLPGQGAPALEWVRLERR